MSERAACNGYQLLGPAEGFGRVHCNGCAASDAREDRLREALERVGVSPNAREVCGVCHKTFTNCELSGYPECPGLKARRDLAAIPPRSDR